jgi:hypothetical protein
MAAIPVMFIGLMSYSDLGVGGGPMPGGPPLGIWGGAPAWPAHPIAPGGSPPGIWPSPGYPAHPIAPGGPPPGIWPSPGHPAHPIAPGGPPPGIWPSPGHPEHPIYFPPSQPPGQPPSDEGKWAWSPIYGWVWVPSGSGDKPHPPETPVDPNAPVVTPH